MSKLSSALLSRSRRRRMSPTETCSNFAAGAGSAAGIAADPPPFGAAAVGADGQRPAMSVAWPAIPVIEAACRRVVLPGPTFAGDAGSAPGTSPSGSDQEADWKLNGTPGVAAAICDRRGAPPEEAWRPLFTSAVTDISV